MKHFEPIKYFLILFFCFNINVVFSNEVTNDELDNNELVEGVLQEEQEITEEKPLTLFDLIDLALKNNPKTKISYNSIVLMNNKIINNTKLLLPNVGLNYTDNFETNTTSTSVYADFSFNNFVVGSLKNNQLKYEKLVKEFEHNDFVNSLVLNVVKNYFTLLSLKEAEVALFELQKYSEKVLEMATFKYNIGLVTVNEKLSAEINNSNNKLKLLKVQNGIKEAKANINNILNIDANIDLLVDNNDYDIDLELRSYEEYLKTGLKNNNILNALYNKKLIESINKSINIVSNLPTVSLTTENDSYYYKYVAIKTHSVRSRISVRFSLNNALYSMNDKKIIDKNINNIDLEIESKKKEISLEIWKMYQKCLLDVESLKNIEETLNYSNKNLDLQIGMYKSNKVSMVELLEAYSKFASSKSDYIRTKFDMLINKAEFLNYLNILSFTNIKEIINIKGVNTYDNIEK